MGGCGCSSCGGGADGVKGPCKGGACAVRAIATNEVNRQLAVRDALAQGSADSMPFNMFAQGLDVVDDEAMAYKSLGAIAIASKGATMTTANHWGAGPFAVRRFARPFVNVQPVVVVATDLARREKMYAAVEAACRNLMANANQAVADAEAYCARISGNLQIGIPGQATPTFDACAAARARAQGLLNAAMRQCAAARAAYAVWLSRGAPTQDERSVLITLQGAPDSQYLEAIPGSAIPDAYKPIPFMGKTMGAQPAAQPSAQPGAPFPGTTPRRAAPVFGGPPSKSLGAEAPSTVPPSAAAQGFTQAQWSALTPDQKSAFMTAAAANDADTKQKIFDAAKQGLTGVLDIIANAMKAGQSDAQRQYDLQRATVELQQAKDLAKINAARDIELAKLGYAPAGTSKGGSAYDTLSNPQQMFAGTNQSQAPSQSSGGGGALMLAAAAAAAFFLLK